MTNDFLTGLKVFNTISKLGKFNELDSLFQNVFVLINIDTKP